MLGCFLHFIWNSHFWLCSVSFSDIHLMCYVITLIPKILRVMSVPVPLFRRYEQDI